MFSWKWIIAWIVQSLTGQCDTIDVYWPWTKIQASLKIEIGSGHSFLGVHKYVVIQQTTSLTNKGSLLIQNMDAPWLYVFPLAVWKGQFGIM